MSKNQLISEDKILNSLKKRFGKGQNSSYIAQLQFFVLSTNNYIEKQLEDRMYGELETAISTEKSLTWRSVKTWSRPFMTVLSFIDKLNLVRDYNDMTQKDYQKIRKMNTFRNVFAHLSTDDLSKKFEKDEKSKQDLLETIDESLAVIDSYMSVSKKRIANLQEYTEGFREGIVEDISPQNKHYKRIARDSILKRIVLAQDEDHDSLGDFELNKKLYIEVDENGEPINDMVKDVILKLPGIGEIAELEDA